MYYVLFMYNFMYKVKDALRHLHNVCIYHHLVPDSFFGICGIAPPTV